MNAAMKDKASGRRHLRQRRVAVTESSRLGRMGVSVGWSSTSDDREDRTGTATIRWRSASARAGSGLQAEADADEVRSRTGYGSVVTRARVGSQRQPRTAGAKESNPSRTSGCVRVVQRNMQASKQIGVWTPGCRSWGAQSLASCKAGSGGLRRGSPDADHRSKAGPVTKRRGRRLVGPWADVCFTHYCAFERQRGKASKGGICG